MEDLTGDALGDRPSEEGLLRERHTIWKNLWEILLETRMGDPMGGLRGDYHR